MVPAISGWFEAYILERLKGFSWVKGFRWWKIHPRQVTLIFSAKLLQYIFSLNLLIFNFQLLNHTIPLSGRLKSLALEVILLCGYSSTWSNHLLTSFSCIVLAILNGGKKRKKRKRTKKKEERKWHFAIKYIRTASFEENQYHRRVHLRKKHVHQWFVGYGFQKILWTSNDRPTVFVDASLVDITYPLLRVVLLLGKSDAEQYLQPF